MNKASFAAAALVATFLCVPGGIAEAEAPPWKSVATVSPSAHAASKQRVVIDNEGRATIAWEDGEAIYASTRVAGGNWRTPIRVSRAASFGAPASSPEIAIDGKGNVTVVWVQRRTNGQDAIVAVRRPAGGAWSVRSEVARSSGCGYFAEPKVAMDPHGTTAVWTAGPCGGFIPRTMTARRPNGAAWRNPTTLANGRRAVAITADRQGSVTVAMLVPSTEQYHEEMGRLDAIRRSGGGAWGAPIKLSGPGRLAFGVHLAVDRAGNVTVAWVDHDEAHGHYNRILTMRRPVTGGWGGRTSLSGGAIWVSTPSVAVTPSGTALVVFADTSAVRSAQQRNGGGWTISGPLTSRRWDAIILGDVATDANGNATIVFVRYRANGLGGNGDDTNQVMALRRAAGGSWGAPVAISTQFPSESAGASMSYPDLAMNGAWRTAVAWTNGRAGQVRVRAVIAGR